jgi:hypothetical protein
MFAMVLPSFLLLFLHGGTSRQNAGASFKGIVALLGMLKTCASNVAVVNIENGFGAG